uniref:Uncharacterized protein n=1 Tax=Anguilla anguilla TaxID=7936 RepID=A0A0E9VLH9_ANGAN
MIVKQQCSDFMGKGVRGVAVDCSF